MIALIVVAIVAVLLFVYAVSVYNGLVRRRSQVDNAWSQIDVQLQRRYDLILNLVSMVKGHASHEPATLEAVTQARADAMGAQSPASKAEAESHLRDALTLLFAVAEAYPDLKADTSFLELQQELSNTRDRVAHARQDYDDAVLAYNDAIAAFPPSVVARMLSFRSREYFRAAGEERGPVRVQR